MSKPPPRSGTALIIVDHGSRRRESNDLLIAMADMYREYSGWTIVEPAHMELSEPSIATAFARCVEQGADYVVIFPYFLAPGKHWTEDIPRLAAEAAGPFVSSGVRYLVTAPIGLHHLMCQIIEEQVYGCMAHAEGWVDPSCPMCPGEHGCQILPVPARRPH